MRNLTMNANDFIEAELGKLIQEVEEIFRSDAISLNGPLDYGVDDVLHDVIESRDEKIHH